MKFSMPSNKSIVWFVLGLVIVTYAARKVPAVRDVIGLS